jgi:pyridinium-3,5-biscarboxylic acid mononucleotide synthase
MNRPAQDDICLDLQRIERIGIEEAVFSQGKADVHLHEIAQQALATGKPMLFTRLSQAQLDSFPADVRDKFNYEPISRTGILGPVPNVVLDGQVAIVCAGTSDAFVAREAERTLRHHGVGSKVIMDVGLAGLHRILNRVEEIKKHAIIIVCAGMDAALPTVLGGLVSSMVIAVPTSVGYGVAAGGESALRATLATCSAGVVVTNIDNGFGAACAALRMLRSMKLR